MLIHGTKDEIVPIASVEKLSQKLSAQKNITIDYRALEGADHFFSTQLPQVSSMVGDYIDKSLTEAA